MFFSSSIKFDPINDIPDLTGKIFIVTGGSSGLGYNTVQHIARKGAKVYLAARNEAKALSAIKSIKSEGLEPGNGEIVWLKLDLSDPKKTREAAESFLQLEKRLDVLVNNAGRPASPYVVGAFGIEETMIVNHFSPFVFTQTLLPLLKETAMRESSDVRIVNLASNAQNMTWWNVRFTTKADFTSYRYLGIYPPFMRYATSKLANVLWTNELQRRLDEENIPIICMSIHPGLVRTEGSVWLIRDMPKFLAPPLQLASSLVSSHPTVGSYNSVFASASPRVREQLHTYKGAYLVPVGKVGEKSRLAKDDRRAKELWDVTESILTEEGVFS